jgi:sugar/nucleoside kinase (ribokinase family)
MADKNVACLGIVVGDFLVKPVERMPEKGKLILTDRTELHIGGCASNTGVVLKRMGVDVAVIGKVGSDNLGKFLLNRLKEEGLDVSRMMTSDTTNTSGTAVFIHADGERSFIHSVGTNADIKIDEIDFDFIKKFSILHIAGALLMPNFDGAPMAETLKKSKEEGLTTCLDTAWDSTGRWLTLLERSLPYVDYFLPSIEEARMLTGKYAPEDVASFLLSRGVRNVGLKMGKEGSFIMNNSEQHHFKALDIEVVDTTGCGDAYAAGFIAGLSRNFSFERCGMLANLTGAKIATSIGATSGVSSFENIMAFGKKYGYLF